MGKKALSYLFVGILAFGSISAENVPPEQRDESLIRLEVHMRSIHDEAEFGRYLSSGLLIGTGALIGGIGYYIGSTTIPTFQPEYRNMIYGIFGLYAGIMIVPGVLVYTILPEAERLPNTFFLLPSLTSEDKQKKVIQGELMLKTMSDNSFMGRMIGGLICLAGGASQLGLYFFSPQSTDSYYSLASGYQSFIYSGCTMAVGGLATLALRSKAETEYETYQAWKDGLNPKKGLFDFLNLGMGVSPRGEPVLLAKLSL